MPNKKDMQNHN